MQEVDEKKQTYDAMVAIIACRISATTIREGYVRVCYHTQRPAVITKSELMVNVSRDFRLMKQTAKVQVYSGDITDPQNASTMIRDVYASSYTRDYDATVFLDVVRNIDIKEWKFNKIRYIDLFGQLIGDKGIIMLSQVLPNCPVEILSLGQNNITDKGLKEFATCVRSLTKLSILHLNNNMFTDEGIEKLFNDDNYSFSLQHINLSLNDISAKGAYAIGTMFSERGRNISVSSIYCCKLLSNIKS
jgi:hypothetical protein